MPIFTYKSTHTQHANVSATPHDAQLQLKCTDAPQPCMLKVHTHGQAALLFCCRQAGHLHCHLHGTKCLCMIPCLAHGRHHLPKHLQMAGPSSLHSQLSVNECEEPCATKHGLAQPLPMTPPMGHGSPVMDSCQAQACLQTCLKACISPWSGQLLLMLFPKGL